MQKTCLQVVGGSTALRKGKTEWQSRDGKSGLEELWRQKELNDGVRGYQDATENLLEEKGNYYPAELRVYKELNNEPEHM